MIGGLIAGLLIFVIAHGRNGFEATGNMAANGYGDHSPTGYSMWAVLITEIVLTAVFLFVILGATEDRAPEGFAGLAIGLTLTLSHLVSIPISNTSVNPARSTGVAFFNGAGAPGCSARGNNSPNARCGRRRSTPKNGVRGGGVEAPGRLPGLLSARAQR